MIFEGRLETGDWAWITDWDGDVTPRHKRLKPEAQRINLDRLTVGTCRDGSYPPLNMSPPSIRRDDMPQRIQIR
jgi:hypothetical protein